MKNIQLIEGQLSVKHAKFALLAGRFNAFIVESLVSGAIDMLQRSGIKGDDIDSRACTRCNRNASNGGKARGESSIRRHHCARCGYSWRYPPF